MPQPHESREAKTGKRAPKRQAEAPPRLEDRTREDLYALARDLEIPGFVEMSKAELIEAIRRR